jgi:hypothetical protein
VKSHLVIAAACAAAVASTAMAQTPEQRMTQLETRVQTLEGELRQYRGSSVSQADQGAVLDKMMADAKARSTVGSSIGKVGYNNGYFLVDEKNAFQLKLNGLLQPRFIYNHSDSAGAADEDESGFVIRRSELYLTGDAFDRKIFFQYGGGFSGSTGAFNIVSAYLGHQFNKTTEIRGGIFKPPFMIEELTSAGRQLAVERSLINAMFTTGTSDGVQVQYSKDNFRVAAMLHDGTWANSTEFSADKTDLAVVARAEIKLAGEWSQFADFEGWNDSKFAARLGVALDYEWGESSDIVSYPDIFKITADLTIKNRGWGLFLAGAAKHTEDDPTSPDGGLDQYGLMIQGGVFVIPNRAELFARYEYIHLDGMFSSTTPAIDDNINVITAGLNWFFVGHNVKLVTDVMYVPDAVPAGNSFIGLMPSPDGPQIVFRMGVHLMF